MDDLPPLPDRRPVLTPAWQLYPGDCRQVLPTLPPGSVQTCVTSPPYYGLRDYGVAGQIGLEETPGEYCEKLVRVFREVRRVLADDGTLWLVLGDSYGSGNSGQTCRDSSVGVGGGRVRSTFDQPSSRANCGRVPIAGMSKQLLGIPWRVAVALQADGWILRADVIWAKPNPMPESVRDRPTRSHEYIFMLAKQPTYYYDADAVMEPAVGKNHHDLTGSGYAAPGQTPHRGNRKALHGPTYSRHRSSVPGGQDLRATPSPFRNRRSVWTIPTHPYPGAHFATFPPALVEPCVLAGSRPGDTILDPFAGTAAAGLVALRHGRRFIGVELNPDYLTLAVGRLAAARPEAANGRPAAPEAAPPLPPGTGGPRRPEPPGAAPPG